MKVSKRQEEALLRFRGPEGLKLFNRKVFRGGSWSRMDEMMDAISQYPNVCVRSGHGVSKSYTIARAGLWFLSCFSPSTVIMTAPTDRQVRNILWSEVEKVWGSAKEIIGGRKTLQRIELASDWFMLAFKSKDYDTSVMSGFHNRNIMIIMDEASGIQKDIWDGASGIKTGEIVKHIAAGQPHDPASEFAQCFKHPNWHKIHISALESPNITGECYIPGLTDMNWIDGRKAEGWTPETLIWRVRVLGEFPEMSVNSLISLSVLQEAVERKRVAEEGKLVMGIDVAREGDDKSVFLVMDITGREVHIEWVEKWDTMAVVGKAVELYNRFNLQEIGVDVIGLGAGVYDRLREVIGYEKVVPVNVALQNYPPIHWAYGRRDTVLQFLNLRAELFWTLKKGMDIWGLLDVGNTVSDLSDLRFHYDSQGRIKIESKQEFKKRNHRSPDFADVRIIALYAACQLGVKKEDYGLNYNRRRGGFRESEIEKTIVAT